MGGLGIGLAAGRCGNSSAAAVMACKKHLQPTEVTYHGALHACMQRITLCIACCWPYITCMLLLRAYHACAVA